MFGPKCAPSQVHLFCPWCTQSCSSSGTRAHHICFSPPLLPLSSPPPRLLLLSSLPSNSFHLPLLLPFSPPCHPLALPSPSPSPCPLLGLLLGGRRNVQMLGSPGQQAVYGSFVVVVGLGGVGSHAAAMLLRSGVGRLRLVDFDQVRTSPVTVTRSCYSRSHSYTVQFSLCLLCDIPTRTYSCFCVLVRIRCRSPR